MGRLGLRRLMLFPTLGRCRFVCCLGVRLVRCRRLLTRLIVLMLLSCSGLLGGAVCGRWTRLTRWFVRRVGFVLIRRPVITFRWLVLGIPWGLLWMCGPLTMLNVRLLALRVACWFGLRLFWLRRKSCRVLLMRLRLRMRCCRLGVTFVCRRRSCGCRRWRRMNRVLLMMCRKVRIRRRTILRFWLCMNRVCCRF